MVVTVLMLSCLCTSVFAAENCNKAVSENVSAELNCNGDNTPDAFYTNFYKNSNCKSLIPLENNVNAKISQCYYQSTPAVLTFSLLKSESISADEETDLLSSGSAIDTDTETTTEDGNNSEVGSEITTEGENSDNATESTTAEGDNSDDATETTTTDGDSSDNSTETTTTNGNNSDDATETTTENEGRSSRSGGGGSSSGKAEKKNTVPEKDNGSSDEPQISTETPEKEMPDTELPLDPDSNDNNKTDDNNSDNSVDIPETDNILPSVEVEDTTVPVEVPAVEITADVDTTNVGTTLPQTGSPFGTVEITLLGLALIVTGAILLNNKKSIVK